MTDAPNFELPEFLASQTATRMGMDNTPPVAVLRRIETLLAPGMQRVRNLFGLPVVISSGYRSPEVNRAVGGAAASQHVQGLAADFTVPKFGPPLDVAREIAAHGDAIRFDQLIFEGQWVHISFAEIQRGEVLTAHFGPGGTRYTKGLA